jgi:hypothetical protein
MFRRYSAWYIFLLDNVLKAMKFTASRFLRTSAVILLSSTLFGCGGGGGAGTVAPPVQTQTPAPAQAALLVTSANATAATVLAFGYGATAVVMGQLAVDWTSQVDSSATLSFTRACAGGGTASATLADRDGDHHASAGDTVTVVLAACYLKELDDTMNGTVTVSLTAPSASQRLAGLVQLSGFKIQSSNPNQEITGAMRFDYSANRLSKLVHVYSDTQPFGMTFSDDKKSVSDTVTMLDAQHETRADTVRATTTMRFHMASNLLGGSLEVTTAAPWSAWFDTYPDAGELNVAGANNSKAGLRTRPLNQHEVDVVLGDTKVDSYPMDGMGVLWTGAPWLTQVANADNYPLPYALPNPSRPLKEPDPAAFLPNGSLEWIYSRPLDPNAITGATFMQTSIKGNGNGMFVHVPAVVSVEGGLLTVKPSTQLQPGVAYELRFSGRLANTSGEMFSFPSFAGTVLPTVAASLVANAAPVLLGTGASLTLDASASTANGAPVASTRWVQISGPALSFSDPNAARVTLSPAGANNGTAVVELQVANAAGDIDRQQFSVTVAGDVTQAHVVAYRIGTGPMTVASDFDPAARRVMAFQGNTVLQISSPVSGQNFLAGLSNGQTWQSGLRLTYGSGSTSGVYGPVWIGCPSVANTGSISILDYALDPSGNVLRLAMDLDDTCGTTVTQVSIRYHSAVPVRQ